MQLTDMICSVNRRLEQAIEAQLKPNGLSIEQYRVLKALNAQNGVAMGDLAVRVFVDSPTLTKIIDKMVASANVYRGPDPRDRRRVLVFISRKGAETFERVYEAAARAENSVLGRLEDKKETELLAILAQLLADTETEMDDTSGAAHSYLDQQGVNVHLR